MDVQRALLSRVFHDEAIVDVVNARITADFFTDERYRTIFSYAISHFQQYGTAPDLPVIKQAFPSYEWPVYGQSLDYFIDLLRQRRKKSLLTAALQTSATLLQTSDDPSSVDTIEEIMRAALIDVRLQTAPTYDVDVTQQAEAIARKLDERMTDPGYLRGISTGFRGIDFVTGGFQPEQFIVMIGLPKAMKSSTLLYMAMQAHRQAKVPLFIGFEMSNDEQEDRMMSLYGNVSLTKVMTGLGMTMNDRKALIEPFKQMSGMRKFITSVDTDSAMTVNGIQAKIMEYSPDVVFIDGAYMMQSEIPKVEPGSPQALTDIARSLKRLAQNTHLPIVVTTQASATRAKGGRLNMFSAMYTQAWQQSADVLLGVERQETSEDDDSGEVPVKLKVLASRSGPRSDTMLIWDWPKGRVSEMDPALFRGAADDDDD